MLRTWSRRLISIPGMFLFSLLAVCAIPLLMPLTALFDVVEKRTVTRGLAVFWMYFFSQVWGLPETLRIWLVHRGEDFPEANHRVRDRWMGGQLRFLLRVFEIRLRVENAGVLRKGGAVLLARHVSTADTMIPFVLLGEGHRHNLRMVLKEELLWDPCIDIVLNRLPSAFVRRGSGARQEQLQRIAELGRGLGPRDLVVVYPEGTRFTPQRRQRLLDKGGEVAERASRLDHLLPPRPAGALAALQAAEGADVILMGHTGWEGHKGLESLFDGGLLGRQTVVRFWRYTADEVPLDDEARAQWLFERWCDMDGWIREQLVLEGQQAEVPVPAPVWRP